MATKPGASLKRQHQPPGLEAGPPPPKRVTRKRATIACEECRVRKRKCDGATPICGGCMKRMSVCVYASDVQAKAWRNSVIQSLRGRLEELEKEDEPFHDDEKDDEGRTTSAPLTPDTRVTQPDSRFIDVTQAPTSTLAMPQTAHNYRTGPGNITSTSTAAAALPCSIRRPHPLPNRLSCGLEPCSVERLMEPINQVIVHRSGEGAGIVADRQGPESGGFDTPCCSCDRILDATQCSLPLRRHADRLVDLYFSRVHLIYPILHQRTFVKQYNGLWQSTARTPGIQTTCCSLLCKQKSQGKTFPAILNAVFALASLFESGGPEQNTAQAEGFFRQAQAIDLLEILDKEVGIELIQLGLLMGFYLQSTERFSKCWNITGLTIRMAQNIGLQLSFSEARKKGLLPSPVTQAEWEMRVRVWYGCVLLDREISMSFGRPLMIPDGGESPKLPEPIDDHLLSDHKNKWNKQPENVPSLLESYIQTINLYDILGEVLRREERKTARSTVSPPETPTEMTLDTGLLLSLDTKIMDWRYSLPSYLQYDPSMDGTLGSAATETENKMPALTAQAKRLYTRFLHVRVLILRPALDLVFRNQRAERPPHPKRPMEARVQDLMLSDIAAQCVHSADKLVHFLNREIGSRTLVAWWYNISYLHTCGSTLLMGQLCSFNCSDAVGNTSASAWELCLLSISRYIGLSSIASKSYYLLQDSAKRLLSSGDRSDQTARGIEATHPPQDKSAETFPAPDHPLHTPGLPLGHATEEVAPFRVSRAHSTGQGAQDLGGTRSDEFSGEFWVDEAEMNSYWSFTPFLSQLETLPSNLDPATLVG